MKFWPSISRILLRCIFFYSAVLCVFLMLALFTEGVLRIFQVSTPLQFDYLFTWNNQKLSAEYIFEKNRIPEVFGSTGYHIAVIGDSFSACDQFDQITCYPRYIHKLFEQEGKNVQIFDYAAGMNNTDREFRFFVDRILPTHPDLVVWQLYTNDVWENVLFPVYLLSKDHRLNRVSGTENWAYKRQAFYNALPMKEVLLQSYVIRWVLRSFERGMYNLSPYGDDEGRIAWGIEKIRLEIEEMNRLSVQHNFHVIYALIPTQALFFDSPPVPGREWMYSYNIRTHKAIESILEKQNVYVPIYFPSPHVSDAENIQTPVRERFYLHEVDPNILGDKHLNDAGNQAVAQQLVEQIHLLMNESISQ